ncbi:ectoine/hydroxyectoine ABC transporter permease subunit EhuC [Taklimakanibacter deserti]|uniref:ectoine/hydroxyectoine ABC transporter permease subunit EhuC n=1 Tax=Taklimakanibacter deserti TaxID=2267839 RepID=UPI0034D66E98
MNLPPIFDYLGPLSVGLVRTIEVGAGAILLSFILAFIAGIGRLARWRIIRWSSRVYVEFFRGTSILVQLFWLYFVLPKLGLQIPPIAAGILALGLNGGAYGSEIVRGALQSFPKGQWEAATALNLSAVSTMFDVVLPQAIRTMLPPFSNLSIEVLKGTALVSLISVTDLTYAGYQIYSRTYRPLEIFSLTLLMYLGLAICLTSVFRALERWAARGIDRRTMP